MINWLDISILTVLAAAIGVGFAGGLVRVAAMSIALYLGSVAAARWYIVLAQSAHRHVASFTLERGQFVMFVGILAATTLVLTPLISHGLGKLHLSRRWEIADNSVGAGGGVATAALIVLP